MTTKQSHIEAIEALLLRYTKAAKNEAARTVLNKLLLDIKALSPKSVPDRSEAKDWAQNTNFEDLPLPDLVPMSALFEYYQQEVEDMSGKRDTEFPYLGFARLLQNAGIYQVNQNKTLPVPQRPLQKYFAIRNTEKWHSATTAELRNKIIKGDSK